MEKGRDTKNDTLKVSLFEFRHNLGLLLDTRYSHLGLQISHIEKEYSFWFANCQRVNLNTLETHEKSWIGLFKNEVLLKDRFLVSTKKGAQYIRSNPDKLAEESKELFDFANYMELQQWKRKQWSDENKTEAESQTGSIYPNLTVVQEYPNHSMKGEFMPEMPPVTTSPQDGHIDFAEEDEQDSGINYDCFYLRHNPNFQSSADSPSTEFLLVEEDTGIETMADGFKNRKKEGANKNELSHVVTPVIPDIEIELKENSGDGNDEDPPIDPMEPWPSSSSPTNSKPRGESISYYSDDCHYGTNDESRGFPEDQTLEETALPPDDRPKEFAASVGTSTSAPYSKRRLASTSNHSRDDCKVRRVAKPPRLNQLQSFEGHIPFDDYTGSGPSNKQNLETGSKYFDDDEYEEGTQNDQTSLSSSQCFNVCENQPNQPPNLIQGSILSTEINMDANLLVQLTGLVKGIRTAKRLEGSSSKSALNDTWIVFPLQDNGLGIYLSNRDGTPFYWNENKWDPNIRTIHPSGRRRPLSFKLPPNSLIYGEIVEVDDMAGRRHLFEEFHVIDIAVLEGNIFKVPFYSRHSICKAYLEKKQPQQLPGIYVNMKPIRRLTSLTSLSMFSSMYVGDGAFHLTRSKTSLEIAGIGLLQLCPPHDDMSGRNEFVFSMNQRYILRVPRPSSTTSSLERHARQEFCKIFNDLHS